MTRKPSRIDIIGQNGNTGDHYEHSPMLSNKILSAITVFNKYAKYQPEVQRREDWGELVLRNMEMHISKYPLLEEEIKAAYKFVFQKKVLISYTNKLIFKKGRGFAKRPCSTFFSE